MDTFRLGAVQSFGGISKNDTSNSDFLGWITIICCYSALGLWCHGVSLVYWIVQEYFMNGWNWPKNALRFRKYLPMNVGFTVGWMWIRILSCVIIPYDAMSRRPSKHSQSFPIKSDPPGCSSVHCGWFGSSGFNRFGSALVYKQENHHLVLDSGPYKLVRHPMYLGFFFLFVSYSLRLESIWGLLPIGMSQILFGIPN